MYPPIRVQLLQMSDAVSGAMQRGIRQNQQARVSQATAGEGPARCPRCQLPRALNVDLRVAAAQTCVQLFHFARGQEEMRLAQFCYLVGNDVVLIIQFKYILLQPYS